MATLLQPDSVVILNGVSTKLFYLTAHNPNKIALPALMIGSPIGVTIHNTDRVNIAANTTQAEQYTRATYNGNMGTVRVHFYVDDVGAWQNLPLTYQSWHAGQSGKADAYGSEKGNAQTISIEVIMNGSGDAKDQKAMDNAARLAAYLIDMYGGELYTHNYWCNIRNGRTGTIDQLNRANDGYKNCPIYIRKDWTKFTNLVNSYKQPKITTASPTYYVQVGAFKNYENAKNYLNSVKKDYPDAFIKTIT